MKLPVKGFAFFRNRRNLRRYSKRFITFLLENSVFLLLGAAIGLIWANINHESYLNLKHFPVLHHLPFGTLQEDGTRVLDLHYLVNDILMTFFFAIAGKEVWEATLHGGPLSHPKRAAVPVISAIGGMTGPALIYLAGAAFIGRFSELSNGWAVPCATDVAFSYMLARIIFGAGHPAIPFLLLLAIADDAMGLLILAFFYPQEDVQLIWMLLPLIAVGLGLLFRRMRLKSFWWYIAVPGVMSWVGFAKAGIHPALCLLPVIPTIPHAQSDKGLFNWEELERTDSLNMFEQWWKNPVELILMMFGLMNAGVVLSAISAPTFLIMSGLIVGKPIGIWFSAMFVAKTLKFGLPDGLTAKDLIVVGFAAGIGFTVALFVATVAFPPGAVQDAEKMGALFSLGAVILTYVVARIAGIKKQ
ncbi:MAG: Na+/H+ antiporter NhaA [Bacteroidales bacterium]|nr:Na+/H+ antiporter NhaA [Bacteroidales bacterium]